MYQALVIGLGIFLVGSILYFSLSTQQSATGQSFFHGNTASTTVDGDAGANDEDILPSLEEISAISIE